MSEFTIDPAVKKIADALPILRALETVCFEAACYGEAMALSGITYLLAQHVDCNTNPDSPEFAAAAAILNEVDGDAT
jgi:hypothetical protein